MTALFINGPADGQQIEIPEAIEEILIPSTAKMFNNAPILSIAPAPIRPPVAFRYRRVGVRGQMASYIYARTEQ